ncbi:MAG: hypothetical protein GEU90_18100 [Gemmatimonas sp.]|nr:hypothetical protein [Gemmatimonas sp.]
MKDMAAFARLVDALRPWLENLVVVGGWSHRLHRFHPLANPPAYLPLMTRDADVAFSEKASLGGDIGEALRLAGFREDFSSEHTPPIVQYQLGREGGFYAEFLAPLRGSRHRRDGSPDATIERAGITAQKLRYMELLLTIPWVVRLGNEVGVELEPPTEVAIANPVSFIAQKLLIRNERRPEKRAQDALYVHDTIELFGGNLAALREIWRGGIAPPLPAKTARTIEALCEEQFGAVTDVIRAAARIPQDRVIRPERMQQVCAFGLEQIFGIDQAALRQDVAG